MKCKVLPPLKFYRPVLPTRMNDQLMYVLCWKYEKKLNEEDCNNKSNERVLIGTWTMDEIRKAVYKGYEILGISLKFGNTKSLYTGME